MFYSPSTWNDTASCSLSMHNFSFLCSLARRPSFHVPERGHCWCRSRLTVITHNPLTHPAPVLQLLRALLRMAHTGTSDPRRPTLEMPSLYLLSIRVAHNQCRVVWKYKSPALWLQGGQTLRCNSSSRAPYRTRDQAGQGTSPKITVLLGSLPS